MMKPAKQTLSRRVFIQKTAVTGTVLSLGFAWPARATEPGLEQAPTTGPVTELLPWILIDTTGQVVIHTHRSEMGQGTFQAIPQIIAEELEVNLDQVRIEFAPANPTKYGPQPQEGSFSIRGWYRQLLQMGASARHMLISAGAARWQVTESDCYAENGQVIHRPSGKKLGYGALVEAAARLPLPQDVVLKKRSAYKYIGKPLPRQDIPPKVTGKAMFGLDKKLPGMLYAMVVRSPRFRGKVKRIDDASAKAVPGVKRILPVQRAVFGSLYEGVAVVATSIWAAKQARALLTVEWDDDGFEHLGSQQITERMRHDLHQVTSPQPFEQAFQAAANQLEAVYETPYQSHSAMEPLNCIAHVQDNRIEVWGPIQEANWIQADLSERMGIPKENVHVHMTFLGGGFGRKGFTDYPHEAALLSKAMQAPVQVIWTREDDMSQGPFRPAALYALKGGMDAQGRLLAFQCISAGQWIGQDWKPGPYASPGPAGYNKGSMDGMLPPYWNAIPHYSLGGAGTQTPIPVLWWRSVTASTSGFACESFMDELAHLAGEDPLAFRRNHLPDARYQRFVDELATVSGWTSRPANGGWGVAITECFTGICGHVVILNRTQAGKLTIAKVVALMDCGWYVNPDTIRAQVEGSIIMGLGAAIKHETTFVDGRADKHNFDTYDMPRITDSPVIEVHIMENDEKPGGVGEPGLPPFAPALCNAIFDLTGKRIRSLPFSLDAV